MNITGKISLTNNRSATGLLVRAYSQSVLSEKLLGSTQSDALGKFEFDLPLTGRNSIEIRVYNPGSRLTVATSEFVVEDEKTKEVTISIDKTRYAGESAYKAIQTKVIEVVGSDSIENISDKKLQVLSTETGFSYGQLGNYRKAKTISDQSHLSADMYFALIEQTIETDADSLAQISSNDLKHHLAVAVEEHIISQIDAKTLLKALGDHDRLNISKRLAEAKFDSKLALGDVWKLTNPTGEEYDKIGRQLEAVKGDTEKLWLELEKDPSLAVITPKLKLVTDLNNVTLGNMPLIARFNSNKAISSIEVLAGWPIEYWIKYVGTYPIPTEIGGKPSDRKLTYARSMKRMVDYLYPARNMRTSLTMDSTMPSILRSDYNRFFQNNGSVDIASTDVATFLEKKPEALVGVRDKKGFQNDLERTGRLLRMSPSIDQYEHFNRLKKMGVNRAEDATKMGYAGFKEKYTENGGDDQSAQWIFTFAQSIQVTLGIISMQFNYDLLVLPYVMNMGIRNDATWQTLFGSEDYCACSHCKSVYSPAAYLADTLHFLEKQEVFSELDKRRPDIQHILLNCENAHTPMPYIDLVNEVLEAYVVNSSSDHQNQTTFSQNELLANPEHVRIEAYNKLKTAEYPFSAPFDYFNELGKTYLKHLGVAHHKLVKLFQQNPADAAAKKDWAKATLDLNELDWSLLLLTNYTATTDKKLWGSSLSNKVNYLLNRSQLNFAEFEKLVNTRFVNQVSKLTIAFTDPCQLSTASVVGLTADHRKRMNQIIRLAKKLETDFETVDAILFALNATELNEEIASTIAQLREWKLKYALPYDELICWLGKMPTSPSTESKRLYEALFFNRTEQVNDAARNLFNLNNGQTELQNTTIQLKGEGALNTRLARNYILGALGISSEELNQILLFTPVSKMNLTTLGLIFSVKSRAQALRIPILDLLKVRSLIPNAVLNDSIKTNLEIELLLALKTSNISIDDAVFIFSGSGAHSFTEDQKATILADVREGLAKLEKDADQKDAPLTPESFIFEKLSSLFGISRGNIMRLLDARNGQAYLKSTSGNSFLASFLSIEFIQTDSSLTSANFPELFELVDVLKRIAILFKGLSFNENHYTVFLTENGKKWMDLNVLRGDTNPGDQLVHLLRIDEMIAHSADSTENLLDVITNLPSTNTVLSDRIDALFGYKGSGETLLAIGLSSSQIGELNGLYLLWQAFALEKHLGVRLTEYASGGKFNWSNSELDEAHVTQIIQVSKAKYGEDKWLNVTAQLRDDFREKQRDALVDFVLAENSNLNSTEDLYAYLLLDVEMSSCTITSRIKLALSSAQLFVQRCLMNFEPAVSMQGLSEDRIAEWEEWSWRKNYRVWEANRKVFLYPENWLEPEWRDDKTPFFKELESELQQRELTTENAEKIFGSYLYKVNDVSHLDIIGMCKIDEDEGDDLHHSAYLFGKTPGMLGQLYFRKYERYPENFGPWIKVNVDFEGETILPIVYDGRLFLFWALFTENNLDGAAKENGYDNPQSYVEISMAWSEFVNDSWTPKRTSTNKISELSNSGTIQQFPYTDVKSSTRLLRNTNLGDELFIDVTIPYNVNNGVAATRFGVFSLNKSKFTITHSINETNWTYIDLLPQSINYFTDQFVEKSEFGSILRYRYHLPIPDFNRFGTFRILDHLQSSDFVKAFASNGLTGLIPLQSKVLSKEKTNHLLYDVARLDDHYHELNSGAEYYPYLSPIPSLDAHFAIHQAYGQYNWELFFHIPMHIANKLRQDQKFEEAQKWFHYVFNPTSTEDIPAPKKFWLFKPFRDLVCSENGTLCNIQDLMIALNAEGSLDGFQEFENAVHTWERNPFSPHTVARTRIVAYMKWVVMRYIDNVIEWADQLFRRDSIESLNEATQLYMLAWNILGGQPEKLKEKNRKDLSYEGLKTAGLDEFSNALVSIENKLTAVRTARVRGGFNSPISLTDGPIGIGNLNLNLDVRPPKYLGHDIITKETLYFCVPQNPKLLSYWDLVRDRFYKLRNCMNIEGVYRQLPLYEPPIDPALLIKAKAAGLSIADALSSEFEATSHYRFVALVQKAIDYANDVRVFGGALLSALEKKDAEKITELRSRHEATLIEETGFIRSEQIKELEANKSALNATLKNIEDRKKYYADKEFMSGLEISETTLSASAQVMRVASAFMKMAASAAGTTPNVTAGYSGWGGHLVVSSGGSFISDGLMNAAGAVNDASSVLDVAAYLTGQFARYERRKEDWDFQADQASGELEQIEKQLIAADIRIAIAKKERENHTLQLENSRDQLELLQTKFTNVELYDWMIGQLKTVYFQSYQMAFDMAKKAEKALMDEFDIEQNEPFIKFGYWDNLKQGLLSGEKLHHDLKRMEVAYIQGNKRKQEVSQTFSLAMIDPQELVKLKTGGSARMAIPEVLFDLVHPKLQNRKVKSVSITIPAVTGPYTGVHATLSNGLEHISTSSGQNDSGLFQLNFNDERYLPFEGSNPASTWDIALNSDFRAFDYSTISDVLLHINYTADYNSEKTSDALLDLQALISSGTPLTRFFSLKSEFANEWYHAKNTGEPLSILVTKEMMPFVFQGKTIQAAAIKYVALPAAHNITDNDWLALTPIVENGAWKITITAPLEDDILLTFGYQIS